MTSSKQNEQNNPRASILNQISRSNKQNRKNLPYRQKVSELSINSKIRCLELVVLRIYPRKLINTESYSGAVAAACGRDETGIVGLVLWGDQIENTKVGDIIRIQDGWCRKRDGEMVVSTGKSGKITILDR